MNYEEIRTIANDGDIIFLTVNKKDILSRIVSFFTKSIYTHAAFVFWYKTRLMIVESTTNGGIRIVQASIYDERIFALISAPLRWEEIEWRAIARSGTEKYGWFSAIYIGIREFLFMHFDIKLPPNNNNRNRCCSEFIAEILEFEDTDISPKKLYENLKPNQIFN